MADPRAAINAEIRNNPSTETLNFTETGFSENWGASLMNFVDEDMSISSVINNVNNDNDSQLVNMKNAGLITSDEWDEFRVNRGRNVTTNWDGLVNLAKAKGLTGSESLKTREELNDNLRDDLKLRREYGDDVSRRATFMGDVGAFTGTLHAAALDPVNALAMLAVPVKAYQGASLLKVMAIEAGIGAGAETLIQPFVYNWKQNIDSPYSGKDAMMNIALGGVLGGTIAGVTKGLGNLVVAGKKAVQNKHAPDPDQANGAIDAVQQQLDELNQAPDTQMSAAEHVQKIDNEVRRTSAHSKAVVDSNDPYIGIEDAQVDGAFTRVTQVTSEDTGAIDTAITGEAARLAATSERKLPRLEKKKLKRELSAVQGELDTVRSQIDQLTNESSVRKAYLAAQRGAPKTKAQDLRNQLDYEKIPAEYTLRLEKLQSRLDELTVNETEMVTRLQPRTDLKEFQALTRANKIERLFPEGGPKLVEDVVEVIPAQKIDKNVPVQKTEEIVPVVDEVLEGDFLKTIAKRPDIPVKTGTLEGARGTLVNQMQKATDRLAEESDYKKMLEGATTCLL